MTYIILAIITAFVLYLILAHITINWMDRQEYESEENMEILMERKYNEKQSRELNNLNRSMNEMKRLNQLEEFRQSELELQRELNRIRQGENYPTDGFYKG